MTMHAEESGDRLAVGCGPAVAAGAVMLDGARLNRIRWRCRRGMLENDLVLTRFLDARGATMDEDEVAMLDRLLDLPDGELWDLLSARTEPRDMNVMPLLQQLRSASI